MINLAQVEYIDVSRTYFEVEVANQHIAWFIFDEEDDVRISMNHIASKVSAINAAKSVFREYSDEHANLYVSCDAIKVKHVKDYFGEGIFKHLDDNISGWLFFFDPTPFANWDHPCKYLLVIATDNFEVVDYDKGLDENIQMEQID